MPRTSAPGSWHAELGSAPPEGGTALDVCTGAGAIAAHLAAEVPSATVIGVDIDPRGGVRSAERCASGRR
ncbi:MAG: hypothetical protein V9G12_19750 [Microthrixaceae bacterium]